MNKPGRVLPGRTTLGIRPEIRMVRLGTHATWLVLFSFAATALTAGCRIMVDRFTDEPANQSPVTTPSVEAARAVSVEPTVSHRDHGVVEVRAEDGMVTHGPLYFEDPFEETGGEDGVFALSGVDYRHLVYGPWRFLTNAVLFPINGVVTPPWLVMTSDGKPSRRAWGMDHDAAP